MKSVLKSLMLGAFVVLSACAKDNGGGDNTNQTIATVPGTCSVAGQIYTTQYGCLPQGSCQAGYVTYQNQCIIATTSTCAIGQVNTQYGCLSQGICQPGQAQLNTQCVPAIANNGYNGYPNGYYQGGGYAGGGVYWQGGGNYYRNNGGNYYYYNNPYRRYQGGLGINAGFYIGGGITAPGMYYGY